MIYQATLAYFSVLFGYLSAEEMLWSQWWAYKGFSGPEYWGEWNADWILCSRGKYQSPIDIDPKILVYDPNLTTLKIDNHKVNGTLINTGHDITINIPEENNKLFQIYGGPLSYEYRIIEIKFHFGKKDSIGSEHKVSGESFSAEIQVIGYNAHLYKNYTDAVSKPHGIAILSIFGIIKSNGSRNEELEVIAKLSKNIKFSGNNTGLSEFSINGLLPDTDLFITYQGSMTQPGCLETVTWIIFNKPIYITKNQISKLRKLTHIDENNPYTLMENNFRPTLPLNNRSIRTNIKPQSHQQSDDCGSSKITFYHVNGKFRKR